MLKQLSEHFHTDRSTLIKKSLSDLYENMLDMEIIEAFEKKEEKGGVSFISAEDILETNEKKEVITSRSTGRAKKLRTG